jgi:Lin1244/Lin1753-like, N-terminal
MSRPQKTGLDYFPLDVHMDETIELLEVDCGLEGFAILIKLYQRIYDNGYYINADEQRIKLLSRHINVDINRVNDVIMSALSYHLFNSELYKKYHILTSAGIQKRYFSAAERRLSVEYSDDYFLLNINDYKNLVNVNINRVNVNTVYTETPINDNRSTQSKAKKSKVNSAASINLTQEGETSKDYAAADFLDSETLKSRCMDSTGLNLKPPEIKAILEQLKAQNLGAVFLDFILVRIRERADVKSPAGFLKKTLLNLSDYPDFVKDFRKARASPPKPKKQKVPKCFCGQDDQRICEDLAQCTNCGAMWEFKNRKWISIPKPEATELSGIFNKKSAFSTGIQPN